MHQRCLRITKTAMSAATIDKFISHQMSKTVENIRTAGHTTRFVKERLEAARGCAWRSDTYYPFRAVGYLCMPTNDLDEVVYEIV